MNGLIVCFGSAVTIQKERNCVQLVTATHKTRNKMSYRYTLGQARPVVGPAVNLCATDTSGKLVSYVNRSCERLLYGNAASGSAKWQSTCGKYRVCVANTSCLAWPRELETIECWWLDKCPHEIRNEWYENLQMGPGLMTDSNRNGWQLIDDGESPAFDDVLAGNPKKLAILPVATEASGAKVTLKFYDGVSREKVRTPVSGSWIEGEQLTLPSAGNYVFTTNTVMPGGLYGVIKPRTGNVVRLYEYDTVLLTYKPLGYYEPSEEVPVYRRSRIPGLATLTSTSSNDCQKRSVTVIAKFRFIPAYDDNDYIQIPHLDAVKLGAQAIFREDAGDLPGATQFWSMAFACLQAQLSHYRGHGESVPIRFSGMDVWGGAVRVLR